MGLSHSPRLLLVHKSPHVTRKSWILDSTPWNRILITGIQISFSGTWILDSNCEWNSGFLHLYSEFQGPGFRIPLAKIFKIPDSTSKNFADSEIRNPLHEASIKTFSSLSSCHGLGPVFSRTI